MNTTISKIVLLFIISLPLTVVEKVLACNCANTTIEQSYKLSHVVFVGLVIDYVPLQSVNLEIETIFKGKLSSPLLIPTGKSGCDYFLPPINPVKGEKYLVFGIVNGKGISVSRCLGSGKVIEKSNDLKWLRKMANK